MRAIVVNDSRAMRTVLKRVLHECGYDDVVEAGDGRRGLLAVAETEGPALVLVDSELPEMTAVDFVGAARIDPNCSHPVAIVIGADSSPLAHNVALEAGAACYIVKPFTKQALVDKLGSVNSTHC